MSAAKSVNPSTPAALWGSELRYYRQLAGLNQAELAEKIFCSRQLVCAMETGERTPDLERVKLCDEALATGGALLRLIEKLNLVAFPPWFMEWPPYEATATVLRVFQLSVVDGLLQTEDYARALLGGDESAVTARLGRQAILTRQDPPPPQLFSVLDEGVLHREVGGPKVMRRQLEHLATAASENIDIQVVPSRGHRGVSGSFVIASQSEAPEVAYVETAARGVTTADTRDLTTLNRSFEAIRSRALPVDLSRDLILRTAEDRWT